jgi:signal transduction histidine kinase
MRLSEFIIENMEKILVEWELFAKTLFPAAQAMDSLALRDHARQILNAVAKDIETPQTDREQSDKAKGLAESPLAGEETAATIHGLLRQMVGFDLNQLGSEYRALRASVIKLWKAQGAELDDSGFYEMMRFNEAIDQALAESIASYANGVNRSRQTFLAILGHDLRSPLNSVSMAAAYLSASESLDALQLDVARRIKRNVSTMSRMIDDLLEYAGGQLGRKIPINPEAEDMEKICRLALEEVQAAHPKVIFNFEKSGDLKACFDPARFQQVLSNLLNNAAKYGGYDMPVTLSAQGESGETITVRVKNFGRPIPLESLQVIFDPLVQVTVSESNSGSGRSTSLGLGLFIAKEIVEGHNGTIEASSSETEGTIFTCQIPRN